MPETQLNDDEVSLGKIEEIIRYKMPSSDKITHEFEEYFKSSYSKIATCGVLIIFFKLI